ncbi:TetR/AcrR family transcriptional regulator C-terminal domain-containing protein [Micromonospora sp. NPDC049679]|uniref:TetR/AcrR family transcriptional regulator n=1 Tax=Micromonospora sp. NPDC049679 TaxID=3155920 RepID=UPI0033E44A00
MAVRRLTERSIASAALTVIDAEGIDGLTMRRLATELGTGPMAVYHHFPDKDTVLEAVTQLLFGEVEPPAATLDWQAVIRHMMCALRRSALRHPNAAPLIGRFPPRTPDALAFVEGGFRALRAAGFDPAETARAYRIVTAYVLGSLQFELRDYFGSHPAAQPPEGSLNEVSVGRLLPTVREVGAELAKQDHDQQFEYGLRVLLAGLASTCDG